MPSNSPIVPTEKETYHFSWVGKSTALNALQEDAIGKLTPNLKASIDFKKSKNIFIEGENLAVLKLLSKEYTNRVKLIYIDPPYNTGNANFVYDDSFKEDKSAFKKRKQNQNKPDFSSADSAFHENINKLERHHSAWLTMMYPRLTLAQSLLNEQGVILISIDDGEVSHLKLLCDEVFGMQNFIGNFIWHNRTTPNDAGLKFAIDHEYILVYAKNKSFVQFEGVDKDLSNYKNTDKDKQGDWIADNPSAASGNENYRFPITNPFTGQVYYPPKGRYWAFAPKRVDEWFKSGKLIFPKEMNKNFLLKKYKSELKSHKKPISSVIQGILTSLGTKELKELFDDASPFKYPKPSKLIKLFIQQLSKGQDIILDFFAGSGTTAQATLDANIEDHQERSFICIQMPEKYSSKDADMNKQYKTVSEVTLLRIKKVIERYKLEVQHHKNKTLNVQCFKHSK